MGMDFSKLNPKYSEVLSVIDSDGRDGSSAVAHLADGAEISPEVVGMPYKLDIFKGLPCG